VVKTAPAVAVNRSVRSRRHSRTHALTRSLLLTLIVRYAIRSCVQLFMATIGVVSDRVLVESAKATAFAAAYNAENFLSTTGLTPAIFAKFYGKYWEGCRTPSRLFRVLTWMKLYPPNRSLSQVVGKPGGHGASRTFTRVKQALSEIASVVNELHYERLTARENRLPRGYLPEANGLIDGVPIYVEAKGSPYSDALYSGKYHDTCLKFEVITDLRGVPVRITGPFEVRASAQRIVVCASDVTTVLVLRSLVGR
jgi:hypothetical protein